MSERTLLLSWTVPPETTGSAVIVGNLAKQFSRDEMILAGERPHGRPAVEWKDEWPEIMYLAEGWPQTKRGARLRRRLQIPSLVSRCLRLVRQHRCTRIVAVFPCEEYLLAGYLTANLSGARLYPYFHNTYLEQCPPAGPRRHFARWLQARVFEKADHVFVMSQGMKELYREHYPHLSCSALVHSFPETIPDFAPPPKPGKQPRFMIAGNINASCEEAARRLGAAVSLVKDSALTILSGTAAEHLRHLGLLQGAVRHETVSRDVLVERLHEADVVLLPHGFSGGLSSEEYRTIFPTKTIEYLICGRPILAHAPPDCFLTRFLKHNQCAFVVDDPSVQAVIHGLERLLDDAGLRSALVRNALRTAETFRASRVASNFRSTVGRS